MQQRYKKFLIQPSRLKRFLKRHKQQFGGDVLNALDAFANAEDAPAEIKKKAREVRALAEREGANTEAREHKDTGVSKEDEEAFIESLGEKQNPLDEIMTFDEDQFVDNPNKLIQLKKLKAQTKPIRDKLERILHSKGMKIGGYVLLSLVLPFY